MGDANRLRSALTTQITALQGELNEMQASQSAIENERKVVASEISDAEKTRDEVMTQPKDKIPQSHRQAIDDAVKAVDDDIDRKKTALSDVQEKLTAAEKALTDAQSQVVVHEKEVGNIKGQLKSLPNQSKAERSGMSRLKSTIRSIANSGQINDTLYAVRELNRVVDELAKLIDPTRKRSLLNN